MNDLSIRVVSILCAAMLLPACGLLSPREDPTRFVILAAVDEMPDASEPSRPGKTRVGLGPITLPDYVQRSEIVARQGGTRIVPDKTERWGEPLQRGVERVLTTDVARILGAKSVILHPWYAAEKPDVQIQIAFARFEREGPTNVVLAARWTIRALNGQSPPLEGQSRIVRAAGSNTGAGAAAALSVALADLCREIAAASPDAKETSGSAP